MNSMDESYKSQHVHAIMTDRGECRTIMIKPMIKTRLNSNQVDNLIKCRLNQSGLQPG